MRKQPPVVPVQVQAGHWEEFLHGKGGQALELAAQGSAGVSIPGGILEVCECGTQGHGLQMGLGRSA